MGGNTRDLSERRSLVAVPYSSADVGSPLISFVIIRDSNDKSRFLVTLGELSDIRAGIPWPPLLTGKGRVVVKGTQISNSMLHMEVKQHF